MVTRIKPTRIKSQNHAVDGDKLGYLNQSHFEWNKGDGVIYLTQREYNNLPESKLTDNITYVIIPTPIEGETVVTVIKIMHNGKEYKLPGGGGTVINKFLSLWNSTTGQPISFPESIPYAYSTGNWFLVDVVADETGGKNYRPTGSSYTGTASTTEEAKPVEVGDVYIYDGTVWLLQNNHAAEVSFANITGMPEDNLELKDRLDGKVDKTTATSKVYGTTSTGAQTTLTYSQTATASSVAQRGAGGTLVVGTPVDNNHAVTKKYVDDNIGDGQLIIQTNGTTITPTGGTFTANKKTDSTIDITIPVIDVQVDETSIVEDGVANFDTSLFMKYEDFEWDSDLTLSLSTEINPSGNFTVVAPADIKEGQTYILRVNNGATAYTMTLGTGIVNPFDPSLITLSANATDMFVFLGVNGVLELQPDLSTLGGAVWGEITGTLSNQTDLQNILDEKVDEDDLATVATTGDYGDLTNKPTIYDSIITVSKNGETIGSFTINQNHDTDVDVVFEEIPEGGNNGDVLTRLNPIQGPCPDGFHIPTETEFDALSEFGINAITLLKMPLGGYRYRSNSTHVGEGDMGCYWTSTFRNGCRYSMLNQDGQLLNRDTVGSMGYSIRPFKNIPAIPDSTWTVETSGGVKVYHNASLGLISITDDDTNYITIADKNLGATTVYNDGDTLSEANGGRLYQWGNNYGFPRIGILTKSSEQVDTTGYGPGNYYSDSTFRIGNNDWFNPSNGDLWGYETYTSGGGTLAWTHPTGGSWGQITGTLSNQTDLQSALDEKITNPSGGSVGNVLKKTASGTEWGTASGGGVEVLTQEEYDDLTDIDPDVAYFIYEVE